LARVDHLMRRGRFEQALAELGKLHKEAQAEPRFQEYVERAMAGVQNPQEREFVIERALRRKHHIHERLRVLRRRHDADRRSDQDFDSHGWQINQRLEAFMEGRDGIDAHIRLDLAGFKNGHNDLRYRTLLADFFEKPGEYGAEGASHLGLGDTATFPSYYFLRSSRLRGINLLLTGERHDFQALYGGYPYWLEDRDEYIYPRNVMGVRSRWKIIEDRMRLGASVVKTRDTGRIRTVSLANQLRDNTVFNLDQEVTLIPSTWFVKAYESYSVTDDNLEKDRFGNNEKLKDLAFLVQSTFIQPWMKWDAVVERTGPDYLLLADLPSGAVNNVKGVTAGRQFTHHKFNFAPLGPFDLDFAASWYRNGLDDADNREKTRQAWYHADLGIKVPPGWPRPRLRGSMTDTISSPGPATRPSKLRTTNLRAELAHHLGQLQWSAFGTYWWEHPLKEERHENGTAFEDEIRWTVGSRLAFPLWKRILVSTRYRYEAFDELFNETRQLGLQHEVNASASFRLWSNASVGLNYTFQDGKLIDPVPADESNLRHATGHSTGANFIWPYRWMSRDKRRKWSATPSVYLHLTDFDSDLTQRPLLTTRLTLGYDVFDEWRLELNGEYRYDKDQDNDHVRTQDSRIWLLWSSHWK